MVDRERGGRLALGWTIGANWGPTDTATPNVGSILTAMATNEPLRLRRVGGNMAAWGKGRHANRTDEARGGKTRNGN